MFRTTVFLKSPR